MSSGLLFLENEDFFRTESDKGPIICNRIKGLCLVLYYSTDCNHCQSFIPNFKKLPGRIGGCQFGMVNVNKNIKLVKASQNTIVPIKYVPYIMLYIDGKPLIRYDGEHNLNMITEFIVDVSKKLKQREQFINQERKLIAAQQDRKMQEMKMQQMQQMQQNMHEFNEVNGIPLKKDNSKNIIPAYTVGIPKKEEELFYLVYEEAY